MVALKGAGLALSHRSLDSLLTKLLIVTAKGKLVIASPCQNEDLVWAFTGGGGGTYGVVLSMTVIKLHKNMPIAGAILYFKEEESDAYWDMVKTLLTNIPDTVDAGASLYRAVLPGNVLMIPQSYLFDGTA